MKKLLIALLALVGIVFVGLKAADYFVMGGESYYVQITTDGQQEESADNQGETVMKYNYSLPGYDKDGKEKEMEFSAFKDRPLKRDAYLKITWNESKGVTSYEEVTKDEIPQAAKEKLG